MNYNEDPQEHGEHRLTFPNGAEKTPWKRWHFSWVLRGDEELVSCRGGMEEV